MADNKPTHTMVTTMPTDVCLLCVMRVAEQFGWNSTECLTCNTPIGHSDCVHSDPFPICESHTWEEIALHAGMEVVKARSGPHSDLEENLIRAVKNYMFVTGDYAPVTGLRQQYRRSHQDVRIENN